MWTEGRIVTHQRWTDSLYSLFIEADIEPFVPGQFGRIALDIDGKRVPRPYSFVNTPSDPIAEFYYIHVPGGLLTERLIHLKPNDNIWVAKKGAGLFTLNHVQDGKTLWMFATGTALGVFLSLIRTQEPWQRFEKIVFCHSVRMQEELTHQETIQACVEQYKGRLVYVPFVSREDSDFAIKGRITDALENGALEERAQLALTPETSSTMICGNPHMVQDMVALLKARGLTPTAPRQPGQITIENYWKD